MTDDEATEDENVPENDKEINEWTDVGYADDFKLHSDVRCVEDCVGLHYGQTHLPA